MKILQDLPNGTKILQDLPNGTKILQDLPNGRIILQEQKYWGGVSHTLHPSLSPPMCGWPLCSKIEKSYRANRAKSH